MPKTPTTATRRGVFARGRAGAPRAFALFRDDADLLKEIATPAAGMRTLHGLALETLVRASHYQGRAFATFRLFSDAPPPRL